MACVATVAIIVAVWTDSAVVVAGVSEIIAVTIVFGRDAFPAGHLAIFILTDEYGWFKWIAWYPVAKIVFADDWQNQGFFKASDHTQLIRVIEAVSICRINGHRSDVGRR
jgi:hypothetical protein